MPSKYLNDARTGELIQKIYTADRAIATECKSYTDTKIAAEVTRSDGAYLPFTGGTITGNLSVNGTLTGNLTGNVTGNADTATNATNATNDANGNPIASTYLPLAGGTMTGTIQRDGVFAKNTVDTSLIRVYGGTTVDNGSTLNLYGKSHPSNAGYFTLKADNGSNESFLTGTPSGSLSWGGVSITDGTFLTTRQVTLSVTSSTSNGSSVNAPAVSGYQFVCWVMSQSSGNVYATYIQNATSSTGRVWWVYSSGTPGGTSIVCTALYVRKW